MQPTGTAGAVARGLSLFLEATQLKAGRTVAAALRTEPAVVEAQVVGIGTRNGRRPAEPVGADVIQLSRSSCRISIPAVAEARGRVLLGTRRLFFLSQGFFLPIPGGNATENRTHGSCYSAA